MYEELPPLFDKFKHTQVIQFIFLVGQSVAVNQKKGSPNTPKVIFIKIWCQNYCNQKQSWSLVFKTWPTFYDIVCQILNNWLWHHVDTSLQVVEIYITQWRVHIKYNMIKVIYKLVFLRVSNIIGQQLNIIFSII